MKMFITGGRCSGKTALMKQKFKSGYAVFSDDNYARLCYSRYDTLFTIIDDAYKDIDPAKYEHLVKLGKHLKLGEKIEKQIKKSKKTRKGIKKIKIK